MKPLFAHLPAAASTGRASFLRKCFQGAPLFPTRFSPGRSMRKGPLSFSSGSPAFIGRQSLTVHRSISGCNATTPPHFRPFSSSPTAAETCIPTASTDPRPGLLQLPGVHTPEQLLQLARVCVRDCEALLESEERRAEETTQESTRRSIHALDAVSNALCKVADAAELIRQESVHPSAEWQKAGAQVVQEVQQFMSIANFSDSIYKRLRGGDHEVSGGEAERIERAADGALQKEEAVVLRCMREAMEQQGIHLSPQEKERLLLLLEQENEAAAECIATQDEAPRLYGHVPPCVCFHWRFFDEGESGSRCLPLKGILLLFLPFSWWLAAEIEVSTQMLLKAGVPQSLIAMRTAELQQQKEQQEQHQGMFSLWGRQAGIGVCGGSCIALLRVQRTLEGVLRTPEAVSTFLERVEFALKSEERSAPYRPLLFAQPQLDSELITLKALAEGLPEAFGVQLPLQPWDIPFLMEWYTEPRRLPLETVWRKATEIVESLTGFSMVPKCPSPGLSGIEESPLCEVGTRGAVDFAEFPSHLFELFAPRIFRPDGAPQDNPRLFQGFQMAHQLQLALLDRAFYSYIPQRGLLDPMGCLNPSDANEEVKRLAAFLDASFNEREVLGKMVDGYMGAPFWKLIGRPPLRAFEHLVHYGANYFCYLFCRCTSSYVWHMGLDKAGGTTGDTSRLLRLLERGSIDCCAGPLLELLKGQEDAEKLQELSEHPERIPLEYLLQTSKGITQALPSERLLQCTTTPTQRVSELKSPKLSA
ncbi:peptidase family m3 domain-containing protein [Cyclospora cayetanensis]|uniref:Peptidase family m3 domain-containing protein n=1 Tax=Cyclospora cayetanensis TaxID=88456 RepID=A0A1D3D0U3_9EIME|nr:peptidase family m3 domain-containing protein [Cyclospora cayetanensis]